LGAFTKKLNSAVNNKSIMQVAIIFTGWLVFWMAIGAAVGVFGFGLVWAGTVNGFVFAVLATFAWPWIMPKFIDDWMDENYVSTW
jgi:hypothetical protein